MLYALFAIAYDGGQASNAQHVLRTELSRLTEHMGYALDTKKWKTKKKEWIPWAPSDKLAAVTPSSGAAQALCKLELALSGPHLSADCAGRVKGGPVGTTLFQLQQCSGQA